MGLRIDGEGLNSTAAEMNNQATRAQEGLCRGRDACLIA